MCAICGVVNFNASDPIDGGVLEAMTSVQAHRGPDDHGYFVDRNVGFGHRRLSIIDIGGGRQPMDNEDGSVVVVFNGEIYNFADIRSRLINAGHTFRTRSDTETIVRAYEQYGDDCVHEFRGMFAFALWDRRNRRLLLARDRLGIKPLYYYQGSDFLVFASEIKSLLQHPRVPREMNLEALDLYLALRYIPGPETMFKNIFKLQPGHIGSVEGRGLQITKYWDLAYEGPRARVLPDEEYIERFRELYEESVRLRLISEVPLGAFLSGGLDSSAILAMMSRITGHERIKTFSVGYSVSGPSRQEASESNEFFYARQAAQHFGAEHYEYELTASEFRDSISMMTAHLDEPMADPSCIPLYHISKLARNHITVVLSGEGADEMFGGYTLYRRILGLGRLRQGIGPLSQLAEQAARFPWGERVQSYMQRLALPIESHYRGVVKGVDSVTRLALGGEGRLQAANDRLTEIFGAYFRNVSGTSDLNRMLYADAKVWLPEDLLLKADKMTMAAGVELRVPFLDHKLVEFASTLPDSLKIRGKEGKWVLRRAIGNELPPAILNRPKKGFPLPAASWLRHEMRDFVRDTLLSPGSACSTVFNREAVENIVRYHEQGGFSGYQEVWSLVVFECWYRNFIQEFIPSRASGSPSPVSYVSA